MNRATSRAGAAWLRTGLLLAGSCFCLALAGTWLQSDTPADQPSVVRAGFNIGKVLKHKDTAVKMGKAVQKASEEITPEQEYYIGRAVAANVLAKYKPLDNQAVNKYLNLVGQSLALASDRPQTFGGYHFLALDTSEINACACPGGLILVSRGLLGCCASEDDLAAVLAHEIGHVQYQHGLKAIKQSRSMEVAKIFADAGTKALVGGQVSKLVGLLEGTVGDIVETMMVSGYSREQEGEADLASLTVVSRVGYDPQGLIRVLGEMKKRFKPTSTGFAKTHPDPQDRINEAKSRIGGQECPSVAPQRTARFQKACK